MVTATYKPLSQIHSGCVMCRWCAVQHAMAGICNRFGAPTILECWSQHLVRKFESVLAPPAHGLRGEIAHSVLVETTPITAIVA